MARRWEKVEDLPSRSYVCGYCGNDLASNQGYRATKPFVTSGTSTRHNAGYIYICHHCTNPTHFADNNKQTPGPAFGGRVGHIPSKEVEALYEEARNCMQVNAHTAAGMCCRKLLMNVAVSEGADENESFAYYVKYLADEGHVTVKAKNGLTILGTKGTKRTTKYTSWAARMPNV